MAKNHVLTSVPLRPTQSVARKSSSRPFCCWCAAYSPYFLGWDASQWVDPSDGVVCIHHPAGDYKMIAKSTLPVEQGVYIAREATHYVVTWTEGETQEGSSGRAMPGCRLALSLVLCEVTGTAASFVAVRDKLQLLAVQAAS